MYWQIREKFYHDVKSFFVVEDMEHQKPILSKIKTASGLHKVWMFTLRMSQPPFASPLATQVGWLVYLFILQEGSNLMLITIYQEAE